MHHDHVLTYRGREIRLTPGIGLSGPVWLCVHGERTIGEFPEYPGESPREFDRRAKEFLLQQDAAHINP